MDLPYFSMELPYFATDLPILRRTWAAMGLGPGPSAVERLCYYIELVDLRLINFVY